VKPCIRRNVDRTEVPAQLGIDIGTPGSPGSVEPRSVTTGGRRPATMAVLAIYPTVRLRRRDRGYELVGRSAAGSGGASVWSAAMLRSVCSVETVGAAASTLWRRSLTSLRRR
jgi:hypothetical protein